MCRWARRSSGAGDLVFLNRLKKSPLFGPVDPKSSQPPTQNEPIYKFRFTVNYAQKL